MQSKIGSTEKRGIDGDMNYTEITSRKNDKIIWASKLQDKKHRDKEGLFICDGAKLTQEAVDAGLCIKVLFFTKKALENYASLIEEAKAKENILVTAEVFEKLTGEEAPQGILSVIEKPICVPFSAESIKDGGFIILEDIQNPQNLGAIFRCAYSLGGIKIVMSKNCADIYSPKTLRSAMGSIFKSQFFVYADICVFIELLKSEGNRVYCTHLHSDSHILGDFQFDISDSVVIGNEGHGVSERTLSYTDGSVIIPMTKNAESLNAATASAIVIWEMNKKKLLSGN